MKAFKNIAKYYKRSRKAKMLITYSIRRSENWKDIENILQKSKHQIQTDTSQWDEFSQSSQYNFNASSWEVNIRKERL